MQDICACFKEHLQECLKSIGIMMIELMVCWNQRRIESGIKERVGKDEAMKMEDAPRKEEVQEASKVSVKNELAMQVIKVERNTAIHEESSLKVELTGFCSKTGSFHIDIGRVAIQRAIELERSFLTLTNRQTRKFFGMERPRRSGIQIIVAKQEIQPVKPMKFIEFKVDCAPSECRIEMPLFHDKPQDSAIILDEKVQPAEKNRLVPVKRTLIDKVKRAFGIKPKLEKALKLEGATRIIRIEQCLKKSKKISKWREFLNGNCMIDQVMDELTAKKMIKNPRNVTAIEEAIKSIASMNELRRELGKLAKTPYNERDEKQETMLIGLWKSLKQEQLEARKSKQWQDLGFQGMDPATDFRGMGKLTTHSLGILGLKCLDYFASQHNAKAKEVLAVAQSPESWYCFAIAGINLSAYALELVQSKNAISYFYDNAIRVDSFYELFVDLFVKFNSFWIERKGHIMLFESLLKEFKQNELK